jgi:DtxR family transcriptional regulator, manganese transport regulator
LPSGAQKNSSERQRHESIRLPRKSVEATEDYLETINSLIHEKGFAASVDIAERMNVSKPTVSSIVKKLHNEGFLVHEKYRGLKLTDKGRKLAQEMHRKHETITRFLMLFGVDERTARLDAEKIEHGLHSETMQRLRAFTEYVLANPELIERYRASVQRSLH